MPIVSHPIYPIMIFAAVSIILHFVVIRKNMISKVGWKKSEYWWLALTFPGFYGVIQGTIRENAQKVVETHGTGTEIMRQSAIALIKQSAEIRFCMQFIKSKYSPNNFEEIVSDYKIACEESKAYVASLADSIPEVDKLMPLIPTLKLSQHIGKELFDEASEINGLVASFNSNINWYNGYVLDSEKSPDWHILQNISVWLIALGLAIRLGKASAEVKFEKGSKHPV